METTSAKWSKRLQSIRNLFDKTITANQFNQLPALSADDYDFYLKSVLQIDFMHTGDIYYKGKLVKRAGK
jgi:hypothetical protein